MPVYRRFSIFTAASNNFGSADKKNVQQKAGLLVAVEKDNDVCLPVHLLRGDYSGSILAEIYVWDGRKVCATLQAHDGPVNTCTQVALGF